MAKSKVYYTDMHVTGERNLLQKLEALMKKAGFENIDFKEKFVAVKVHFGEPGNLAYLRANYAKVICDYVKKLGGKPFVTDCNTLQVGGRKNALDHLDSAYTNGYNPFTTGVHTIIADGLKGTEERLVPVEGGEYVKEAKIGSAIMDDDIIISLNHFKGHELTGFGGALKNLGMGCGSRAGKMEMHSAGKPQVEQEYCVGCGRCIGVCPKDAVMAAFDEANDVLNFKIAEYTKGIRELYLDKVKGILSELDYLDLSKDFSTQKERLEKLMIDTQKQLDVIERKMLIGDNRRQLIEQYTNLEHLDREIVEKLIDYVLVGKKDPVTKEVPIEIHWNF